MSVSFSIKLPVNSIPDLLAYESLTIRLNHTSMHPKAITVDLDSTIPLNLQTVLKMYSSTAFIKTLSIRESYDQVAPFIKAVLETLAIDDATIKYIHQSTTEYIKLTQQVI